MKICINAGHAPDGNPDPGACNESLGVRESDISLSISYLVKKYLQNVGYEINLIQSDSLQEICDTANYWGADLFISIHCNSADSKEANGTEVWAYAMSEQSHKIAQAIYTQIVTALNTTDRGVKKAIPGVNGLYVLTHTNMIACLVETAFISNDKDAQLLINKQDDFARAIARGVTDYEI